MQEKLKKSGTAVRTISIMVVLIIIYPGKLTDADTFRIGVIGEIYQEDILKLTEIMKCYMESVK